MERLNQLRTAYKSRKSILDKKVTENEILQRQITENEEEMKAQADQLEIGQEALQFLEDVANSRRGAMKTQIETIVTEALQLIYGPDCSIELSYGVKNNRSFMDIEFVKQTPDGEVKRTMDGFGGGVSDCISVPLRLLVLIGSRQTDKVCILDECYKHVDVERIEQVADFIKEISEKLGIQVIMCSHHEAMKAAADTIYQIRDVDGRAEVTPFTTQLVARKPTASAVGGIATPFNKVLDKYTTVM